MEDSEVLRRENMSQKRKTRNAIEVCKKMEAEGEVERLYRDFHIHLKTAREKTVSFSTLPLALREALSTSLTCVSLVYHGAPGIKWLRYDRHLRE